MGIDMLKMCPFDMSHNKHFLTFHFLGLNTKSITTPATYGNSYCNAAANDLIALICFITADTKH